MTRDNSLDAFRAEAASYIDAHCPHTLRTPILRTEDRPWAGRRSQMNPDQRQWLEAMVKRGWTVPNWPIEFGGAGLDKAHARVLQEELDRLGARPPLEDNIGLKIVAPGLMAYATEQQKKDLLPPMARGDIRWCQGYSEPGAGSDLASLQTRAVDDGSAFIVNGSKLWTSHAHMADWIFCLVRTNPTAPKREGISVLVFDMMSPGVSVRPLKLISGHTHFCEVRFENVPVPKPHLIGPLNGGWRIAKHVLLFERQAYSSHGERKRGEQSIVDIAREEAEAQAILRNDPVLRADIIRHEIDVRGYAMLLAAVNAKRQAGDTPGDAAAGLKLLGTELNQRRQELLSVLAGVRGLAWSGDEYDGGLIARTWLRSRGNSIEGGTSEIQLNIIAERVLGLPKSTGHD